MIDVCIVMYNNGANSLFFLEHRRPSFNFHYLFLELAKATRSSRRSRRHATLHLGVMLPPFGTISSCGRGGTSRHAMKGIGHRLSLLQKFLDAVKVFACCGQLRGGGYLLGELFAVGFLVCTNGHEEGLEEG
jgi:hypothetical protein